MENYQLISLGFLLKILERFNLRLKITRYFCSKSVFGHFNGWLMTILIYSRNEPYIRIDKKIEHVSIFDREPLD
jgi:hypothetical protein